MQRALLDLLKDAPPPRYGVDDVVAAARRRRRRRNTGWAIAAVVAVATAIGVPQIVTHPDVKPTPVVTQEPATGPMPARYDFSGYAAGKFRVSDPYLWTLYREDADVTRAGDLVGMVVAFHRGVDAMAAWPNATRTTVAPVGGRQAFSFVAPSRESGDPGTVGLVLTYDDGFVAMVKADIGQMSDTDLRQVAEGFQRDAPRPAKLAFRVGHVPAGFRVVYAGKWPDDTVSSLLLVNARSAAAAMASPARSFPPGGSSQPTAIELVKASPLVWDGHAKPTELTCYKDGSCLLPVSGGRYMVRMQERPGVTVAEVRKTLASIKVADASDVKTWYDVNQAVPIEAQVTGQD